LSGLGGTESKRLTPQRRERLTFTLRALDARLANERYRAIAQGLFGEARVLSAAHWKSMTCAPGPFAWCAPDST
jgi:hypothetical protein